MLFKRPKPSFESPIFSGSTNKAAALKRAKIQNSRTNCSRMLLSFFCCGVEENFTFHFDIAIRGSIRQFLYGVLRQK